MAQPRSPGSAWLAAHWDELRIFNFQWVAADGDGLFANDPLLETVIEKAWYSGRYDTAAFALVDFDEELGDEPPGEPPHGPPVCHPSIPPWR
jgi:hypothetical protein